MVIRSSKEYTEKLKFIRADIQRITGMPFQMETIVESCIDLVYNMVRETPDEDKRISFEFKEEQ